MTLGEAKLSEMFKKVRLVDAFVYRSMQHVPFIFLNFSLPFFAFFMSIYLRTCHEC
jgi:hypothetical protein